MYWEKGVYGVLGDVLGEGSLWCAWGCTGRREFMVCLGMYWEKGVYGVLGDVLGEGSCRLTMKLINNI